MYIPKHFEITDKEEVFSFIAANAFGQIVSTVGGRPFASHVPFLVSEDETRILGHLAKQNPQHLELDGQEALIIFQGPHDYISPSWYSSPGVPTWNYQAVHVYGQCRVFQAPDKLQAVVDELTNKYEQSMETPWQPSYKSSMLGAIIGFEVSISEVQCKYKLSQNRSSQDQHNVIEQLESGGSEALASAMARKAPKR